MPLEQISMKNEYELCYDETTHHITMYPNSDEFGFDTSPNMPAGLCTNKL